MNSIVGQYSPAYNPSSHKRNGGQMVNTRTSYNHLVFTGAFQVSAKNMNITRVLKFRTSVTLDNKLRMESIWKLLLLTKLLRHMVSKLIVYLYSQRRKLP